MFPFVAFQLTEAYAELKNITEVSRIMYAERILDFWTKIGELGVLFEPQKTDGFH